MSKKLTTELIVTDKTSKDGKVFTTFAVKIGKVTLPITMTYEVRSILLELISND